MFWSSSNILPTKILFDAIKNTYIHDLGFLKKKKIFLSMDFVTCSFFKKG